MDDCWSSGKANKDGFVDLISFLLSLIEVCFTIICKVKSLFLFLVRRQDWSTHPFVLVRDDGAPVQHQAAVNVVYITFN